jgi:N4-gp56 family major capsid protein
MTDTVVASGLTVEQWDSQFFTEYLTENRFQGEMGTSESSIIQVKENLTKKPGDRVNYALVNKLTNDAVTGSNVLEGNEEDMASRSFEQAVNKRRNGVRVAEIDEQFSAISLREAAKAVLKDWSLKDTETLIIQALASIDGTNYASASESAKDTWLTNNLARVYDPSGTYGTDHSAMLAQLDTTNDKLTAADIDNMKYRALVPAVAGKPRMRPIRVAENGRHYFILYVDPRLMRDLKQESSSPIMQAQREVALEMENNRLFQGGDLLWNGVIIKEIHQMYDVLHDPFENVGNGATTEVGCAFLCGAQAIAAAYAKRWTSKEETFDYGDKKGVAIEAIYGIGKMRFGTSNSSDTGTSLDNGVLTGYFATTD